MNKIANVIHKLFYDNKVLMVFSFVVAVIIWLLVVISFSPVDTTVIKDVPVTLDLANSVPAQFDLEIFGQSEFFVDVEVSGKRYILSSVADKNSIKVVAQTAYVDSAGKHTLSLKASKVKETDEFEIVGLSDEFIEVFFDVYMEQDFNVEPKSMSRMNWWKKALLPVILFFLPKQWLFPVLLLRFVPLKTYLLKLT